jgi:cyclohexyl-isocyanide hydratase
MADQKKSDGWDLPGRQLEFGMLLYPGFTLLDLAGPQTVFGLNGKTHLIWKTMDPVPTDMGVSMNPTMTFAEVPDKLDVLFVPGGFGTNAVMQDTEILDFLARAGAKARYVTSVCTGSVILAMAGLLDGYRAATHWAFYEPLAALGVETCHERVTVDRNRITGGGVTAGVDFGLTVVAELKGQDQAEFTQLALEYCPQPPFNAGHPSTARQEIIDMISGARGIMGEMTPQGVAIAKAHKQRLAATLASIAPAASPASA